MHRKQNNKESKTYVQGLRSFGNTLPRGVKGILKKNGYNYSEIISKWNMLVGKDISSCSYPKSIKMTKGDANGTLVLAVKRGNEITVEYSKKEIINKTEEYHKKFSNPFIAASRGYLDDIILPHNTRHRISISLDLLKTKQLSNPNKKHGNIPL
mgnify:CR=1 FL=1